MARSHSERLCHQVIPAQAEINASQETRPQGGFFVARLPTPRASLQRQPAQRRGGRIAQCGMPAQHRHAQLIGNALEPQVGWHVGPGLAFAGGEGVGQVDARIGQCEACLLYTSRCV